MSCRFIGIETERVEDPIHFLRGTLLLEKLFPLKCLTPEELIPSLRCYDYLEASSTICIHISKFYPRSYSGVLASALSMAEVKEDLQRQVYYHSFICV